MVGDDGRPQQLPWEDWSDIDLVENHTSAWMRATAPSGDADFEGIVAWAGELGYGERPAERGQRTDDGDYADHEATIRGPSAAASRPAGRHPQVDRHDDDAHDHAAHDHDDGGGH